MRYKITLRKDSDYYDGAYEEDFLETNTLREMIDELLHYLYMTSGWYEVKE